MGFIMPIVWKSDKDEIVEITILEKEGVHLRIRKPPPERSARIATIPWKDWKKLVDMINAHSP